MGGREFDEGRGSEGRRARREREKGGMKGEEGRADRGELMDELIDKRNK